MSDVLLYMPRFVFYISCLHLSMSCSVISSEFVRVITVASSNTEADPFLYQMYLQMAAGSRLVLGFFGVWRF